MSAVPATNAMARSRKTAPPTAMPKTTPDIKVKAVKSYGAKTILIGDVDRLLGKFYYGLPFPPHEMNVAC